MTEDILISYIVTVYNKEPYVGFTTQSLLKQEGSLPSEYIFVDDVSTDKSLEVIEEHTRGIPNVTIIKNTTNAGPSIRINQGARLARGKYLQFIDSDDVLAANATLLMFSLIERYQADVVHGNWKKTGKEAASLVGQRAPDDAPYHVSNTPMEFVLTHRTRRMSQMVRRDTFLAAGGCDERIFVQDESLSLRLGRVAELFILFDAPILLIPHVEGELSRNVSQLNHDRFLAARNMLLDFPDLDGKSRERLWKRCISSRWKQERLRGMDALFTPAFRHYMRSRMNKAPFSEAKLNEMSEYFDGLLGVRRVG